MKMIQVCINKNDKNQKNRGDLLEKIAKEFLERLDYSVETEVRKTGMELDLLCKANANPSKQIYVECKAYQENNKIQADVIEKIVGIKTIKKYNEVWLIALSELGKDAKGLKEEIQEDKSESKHYTFYTPKEFLEALQNNKLICNPDIPQQEIKKRIESENTIGNHCLLITEYGYFWAFEHKQGGKPKNIFVAYANNGELVEEKDLLENLQNLDSSFSNLNFNFILDSTNASNSSSVITDFKLGSNYFKSINDIGIKLTHPNKNELTLSDIFCYQDLQNLQDINDNKVSVISSERILTLGNYKKCIIFGEEVSGKTALLRMYQIKFNENGLIPICINAKDIKTGEYDKFENLLIKYFKNQYGEYNELNTLIKNKKDSIVLLIDDLEDLGIKKREYKPPFFKMLSNHFENILIFSDDSVEMEILTKREIKDELDNFKLYKIKEYGYKLRDTIIEKWLNIGVKETISDNELFDKKDKITKVIDTLIGTKFIPTYPLYIVVLLQQIESGTSHNLSGSAYAEFYNYLINEAMGGAGIKPEELDFYHTYLSFIAYEFFIRGVREIDKLELENIHEKYCKEYHKRNFQEVYEKLIKARLIKNICEVYSFGQNYIYYFYVAKYLSDNSEKRSKTEEIQNQINMIIERLYRIEFANIIIFFIHHSKARAESIIEQILNKAKNLFQGISAINFSTKELENINKLIDKDLEIAIKEDTKPEEYRKKELEYKDEIDNKIPSIKDNQEIVRYDEEVIDLDIFGKTNLSMKLMEIIGQIAKNYYGSLPKNEKMTLLNEVINLGLSNLNFFIQQINEYQDSLIKEIDELNKKTDNGQNYTREQNAKRIIFNFVVMMCFGFTKKISTSISSEYLFDEINNLDDNNANSIIKNAVKLEFSNGLHKDKLIKKYEEFDKDNNSVAKELLRIFVLEHLYKFDVKYNLKQSVCQNLKISLSKQNQILIAKSKDKK
ncbi:restriction endonuclease [Helicobacter typhlonius]|uniref:STAND family AAA ATPase n=3 Tax=Helicobacter typhlonius TaxID=76936 RepID=UPI002FE2382F